MPSEIKEFLNTKLCLDKVSDSVRDNFMSSIIKYLEHGRKNGVVEGRSAEFLNSHLDEVIRLFDAIELSFDERIVVLTNMPSMLNTSRDLFYKYMLLGAIENDENSFRKNKLVNKTNDFRIGLRKLYGRYVLATNAGYPDMNWNLLVHSSDKEFANRFVKNAYYKPYQMFDDVDSVNSFVEGVTLESLDLSEIMSWDVNREIVEKYGKEKNRS